MKNKFNVFLFLALAAVMTVVSSCAMLSSFGGTAEVHGLFTFSNAPATEGYAEIGSYTVILGLFDTGYKEYAEKVKEAEASNWQITTVTKYYFFFMTTKAYVK